MCHQSVGLVHGKLEQAGIPCISTTVIPYITRYSLVSRSVYIRFPQGAPLGEPNQPEQQRVVLGAVLDAFESIEQPGTMVELPFRWRRVQAEAKDDSKCEGYQVATEGMEAIRAAYQELIDACERHRQRLEETAACADQDPERSFAYARLLRRDAQRADELLEILEKLVGDRITFTSRRSFLIQLAWEGKKI